MSAWRQPCGCGVGVLCAQCIRGGALGRERAFEYLRERRKELLRDVGPEELSELDLGELHIYLEAIVDDFARDRRSLAFRLGFFGEIDRALLHLLHSDAARQKLIAELERDKPEDRQCTPIKSDGARCAGGAMVNRGPRERVCWECHQASEREQAGQIDAGGGDAKGGS